MTFYVYIIQSDFDKSYYKGFSHDPLIRLQQHNNGETSSTRHLIPWNLVYIEELASKTEAIIRERSLKKATRERILALTTHPKNIVAKFLKG
jgi:putative endonuclease